MKQARWKSEGGWHRERQRGSQSVPAGRCESPERASMELWAERRHRQNHGAPGWGWHVKYPPLVSGVAAGGRKWIRHTKYRLHICQTEWLKYLPVRYLTCGKGVSTMGMQRIYNRYGCGYLTDSWTDRFVSALLVAVGYEKYSTST